MDMRDQVHPASIIIPTWNGKEYIDDCLNSLLAQDYPDFEVIVVDNGSSDATPDWVAEHFPTVTVIRRERNLGFAGGVNVGLRVARGEVFILFNQDAVAEPGWLAALVSGLLAAPDIGIAGCKILDIAGKTIQHAGGYLTMPQALPSHFGIGQAATGQYDQSKDVDFVTGAAFAIRREVLESIGFVDESFCFYFEDVDYCYRARAAGFRIVYLPDAVLRHHGKASLGDGTVSYHTFFHTSRLQFVLKHQGVSYFISQFRPAEGAWLGSGISPDGLTGLRQAYQSVRERAARIVKDLSFDSDTYGELLSALCNLRWQAYVAYSHEALCPPDRSPRPQKTSSHPWWEVQERLFVSSVPLVGPLIAWFRTLWNSVSTKWFVRDIRQQQNEVNRIVLKHLDTHSQVTRDFDQERNHLIRRLAEILCRLDEIERHLVALELKR